MDFFRQISMDGRKLLGSGKSGDVYEFDQGRIVKLYRDGRGEYKVLKEFLAAVLMEQEGMNAMKPYEVVKCGEAFGIIYEMLRGISLKDRICQEPERAGEYEAYCARVMRENHSILLDEDYGLSVRHEFVRWAESMGMEESLKKAARSLFGIDYSKPARTGFIVKGKFLAVRALQKNLGKTDPEYTDFKYWKSNGWTEKERPWKRREP